MMAAVDNVAGDCRLITMLEEYLVYYVQMIIYSPIWESI